jgi:hypothetical protein
MTCFVRPATATSRRAHTEYSTMDEAGAYHHGGSLSSPRVCPESSATSDGYSDKCLTRQAARRVAGLAHISSFDTIERPACLWRAP